MVEKSNTSSDFMARMLDLQQQYLTNLGQLFHAQQGAGAQSPFEAWWAQFPSSGESGFDEFFRNMVQASMTAMQQTPVDLSAMLNAGQLPPEWFDLMQNQFNDWLKAGSSNPVFEKMNEQLRQLLLQPFGFGMDGANFNPAGLMDSSIVKLIQNLLNGEEKLASERLLKTLEVYQQQIMQMNHMMAQVGIDSINALQSQFEQSSDSDIKQVYESWMQISKQVFNELKLDDRYRELHASMRKVEQQLKTDLDQYRQVLISQLGLVAREDYDELRKELNELKAQVAVLASAKPQAASATAQARPQSAAGSKAEPETQSKAEPKAQPSPVEVTDAAQDDFTVLNGIGSKFNEKLHEQGVHTLAQLASMSDDMLKALDQNLNTNGRLFQQQWREQADQVLNSLSKKK
jgi:predicted flap endonuclease-1-like 5' DNA nuclease